MILDGKKVKEEIFIKLEKDIALLNKKLCLAVIQIGNDEASNIYIRQKEKMCSRLNIDFKNFSFDTYAKEEEINYLIKKLNEDETVTGILLQLPIPKHFNVQKIVNIIRYDKDIDGLTIENNYRLINNLEGLKPCTAQGIITLLDYYNIDVLKKHVVVVGRSNLVGKPVANMLLNKDSTVTICHSQTENLNNFTKLADILIVATGSSHLINSEMVKKDCVIIDVGISRINNKLFGDVDFEDVKDICSYITPVPGGVGPMTIATLAQNIYEASLLQNKL